MEMFKNVAHTLKDKTMNVVIGLAIIYLWVGIMNKFLQVLELISFAGLTLSINNFVFACILAPLWEEAAFRYAPITIAKKFGKDYLLPVIVISSIIFGWLHGHGVYSLIFQGVMGLVLSWVYIKNNYSYWSSVALHSAWNTLCILAIA